MFGCDGGVGGWGVEGKRGGGVWKDGGGMLRALRRVESLRGGGFLGTNGGRVGVMERFYRCGSRPCPCGLADR